MANNRLFMRKLIEVLRLYFEHNYFKREIAHNVGATPTKVTDYLSRAKVAGLSYPLPLKLDKSAINLLLFPPCEQSAVLRPPPDWATVRAGLRGKGGKLDLL